MSWPDFMPHPRHLARIVQAAAWSALITASVLVSVLSRHQRIALGHALGHALGYVSAFAAGGLSAVTLIFFLEERNRRRG
jgi:hypothetical protein